MKKTSQFSGQSEAQGSADTGGQQEEGMLSIKAELEALFDPEFYRQTYPDLAALDDQALQHHWLEYGYKEGRYGSEAHQAAFVRGLKLDPVFYRKQYPELSELDEHQLTHHWCLQGYKEGRFANEAHRAEHEQGLIIDLSYYRNAYPDIAGLDDKAALQHWYAHGFKEGRSSSAAHHALLSQGLELDVNYYRQHYADMEALDEQALKQHWFRHGFVEGRSASEAHAEMVTQGLEFDPDFYRDTYEDAKTLSDVEARKHWLNHGYHEGRFVSHVHQSEANQSAADTSGADGKPYTVDLALYLTLYPDLATNGIATIDQAEQHFHAHGKNEDRAANLSHWAVKQGFPEDALPAGITLKAIQKQSAACGSELSHTEILDALAGKSASTAMLAETEDDTYLTYCELAVSRVGAKKHDAAKQLLLSALNFQKGGRAFQLLGDSYLSQRHYTTALAYYRQAARYPDASHWVQASMATCLAALQRDEEAIGVLHRAIQAEPKLTQQQDKLDDIAESYWNGIQSELFAYVDAGDRERLIERTSAYANTVYNAYFCTYGEPQDYGTPLDNALLPLPSIGNINQRKVLIVADFHVPQCVRYRIDQKVEQLESAGKVVTTLDWQELDEHFNTVALHDVVIFYRVPAVPNVIKAIAQVNAAGKLSFYEIDDLLFDPIYPPDIQSYGGYVSLETYRGLTQGMAQFNSAARLCRYGITSSEPLRKKLAPLVQAKHCLLHRNGLDHLNYFKPPSERQKSTVDIFYGSGTQAHNIDFIELALPALERVLEEQPHARLVVVGYLRLPGAFCDRFASQLAQLPPVKNVQGYWSLLEQADINMAVLQSDTINDCKSELKWFEAACFAIPSVVSDTANYHDVINRGEDAYLVSNSDEWYEALTALISDSEHRQQMGIAAQQRVQQEYSVTALGQSLSREIQALLPAPVESDKSVASSRKKRKKVALVNVFFPPQAVGGATRVVADNFAAIQKHYSDDIELCVFTGDADCRTPHELSVYQYQGARVYRATTLWRVDMDWHPEDELMYRLFSEFIALEQPDIIHFHCVQRLTASVVAAAKDAGVPYIVTAHDAWWISDFQFLVDHNDKVYPEGHPDPFAPIALPPTISLADSIARRRDLKDLLNHAKKVLTVSNAFAEIYRKNGVPQIEVIPNGISDDVDWAPKDTSYTSRVVCGHVGGMAAHKGYYLLRDAVMEAQPDNLEFIIVDHSKDEGYCTKRYWGKVPVTFIGRVSQERVVDLYRQMDVLFAPSLWPESFGLVTREAAACGCWIVASSLGGIGEDVIEGETGYNIKPKKDDVLNILVKISQHEEFYKKFESASVQHYSLNQVNNLLGSYND